MPRLVRKAPLMDRLKAYLDPYDLLLWLAEELNDDGVEDWLKEWSTPIGLGLNVFFILARGASSPNSNSRNRNDDIFGEFDTTRGTGWFTWLATFLVHALTLVSCINALYTFLRKRHYRLFEQPVDLPPQTPSAHRVRVDSSPASSSPFRYIQTRLTQAATSASNRAYPDASREVWELGLWDPKPAHLTIFTLFSPGHVLLYYALLPPAPHDPRPSVTILTAIAFSILLSLQLGLLKTAFTQQSTDSRLIHGEVMNEYDTKYVHPNLNKPVRDVGTQTRESATTPRGTKTREVDVYTPTTILNRGFRTNPNPNYAGQYDPHNLSNQREDPAPASSSAAAASRRRSSGIANLTPTPSYTHASTQPAQTNPYANHPSAYQQPQPPQSQHLFRPQPPPDLPPSSPLKPHHERLRERSPRKGDGGSLGVWSHANSPLRKATSRETLSGSGGAGSGILRREVDGARRPPSRGESGRPGSRGGGERGFLRRGEGTGGGGESLYRNGSGSGSGFAGEAGRRRDTTGRF
ncbi:hypothetical protein MBLNU230_g4275t1 [Neophaeotheca triangularis]